jgi:PDZ domain-containing protein
MHVNLLSVGSTNGVPDKHGKTPLIGVVVQDQIDLPVNIQIRPGDIGGPSAGLMFSLGLVERLGGRDITKGCKIAGTGTIDYDGAVGAIGGATQKVIAAQNAGAEYFLVPATPDNAGPAKAAAGHITVVPVKSLQGALRYLRTIKPCR